MLLMESCIAFSTALILEIHLRTLNAINAAAKTAPIGISDAVNAPTATAASFAFTIHAVKTTTRPFNETAIATTQLTAFIATKVPRI